MGSKALIFAILGVLAAFLPDRGFAAGPSKYAILTKGKSCSFDIAEVSIKSFRLLAPMEQIDKLAGKGLVNVHVCECYLMPGNLQKCVLDAVRNAEVLPNLRKEEANLLGGKMFLLIENQEDFVALYMALQTGSSPAAFDLASRLLRDSNIAPPPVAPPPPTPPSPPSPTGKSGLDAEKGHRRCEVEPQICLKPKKSDEKDSNSSDITAEFEVKCEGFPPIIVSTEGKAGFKVGPIEISVSKP
jgi:hypothetical protein